MKPEKFIFITFLTILYFFVGRFIGWTFLSRTEFWNRIINDNLHHYQLGIAFLVISFILLKKKIKLGLYLLAIGSGMVIDESMYVFEFINPVIFTHYHPVGIAIELLVFLGFSAFIFKNKKRLINLFGAPNDILHRLPEFVKSFNSTPILPEFLYEIQPDVAAKTEPKL